MQAVEVVSRGYRLLPACRRLFLLMLLGLCAFAAHAATLDPAVLPKIQAATFEVVAAKPVDDPLSYEKPLPLELLPFQERNDKYYSIGTAFALGNNRYVTAAHVLQVGQGSLWGAPALRDAGGHVYAIDKVEKFSLQQDFVVFSLATQPDNATALEVNDKPTLNDVVYAVGNALGTGVVIRDGLYTSDTPEEQDGRWKWMRFSAAASPGNSGGPLLDKDGKLIGIVLMKSANENLNYALPISEVLAAPDNLGVMDTRGSYQLDIFDTRQIANMQAKFKLPLPLAAFYREFQKHLDEYSDTQIKALLAKESERVFPRGDGSRKLLFQPTRMAVFPSLIVRGSNGEWGLAGDRSQHFALDGNGYVDVGSVSRNGFIRLRRPDGVDAAKFYGDPATRMDLLTRTGMFQREIGGERVKITSLGKPREQTVHMDRWQRPWQVEVWPLPYANTLILLYALPVPDGYVMLSRFVPASNEHDSRLDLDELSNYVYLTYSGTLAQWKQFMAMPKLLPAALKQARIDIDYDRRFAWNSPDLAFSFTPEQQAISPDSLLYLGFRFLMEGQKPTWDVGAVVVWKTQASGDDNRLLVERVQAPPQGLDEDMSSRWQKLSARSYPYNAEVRQEDGTSRIDTVVVPSGEAKDRLYDVSYSVEGNRPQADMKKQLDAVTDSLRAGRP